MLLIKVKYKNCQKNKQKQFKKNVWFFACVDTNAANKEEMMKGWTCTRLRAAEV